MYVLVCEYLIYVLVCKYLMYVLVCEYLIYVLVCKYLIYVLVCKYLMYVLVCEYLIYVLVCEYLIYVLVCEYLIYVLVCEYLIYVLLWEYHPTDTREQYLKSSTIATDWACDVQGLAKDNLWWPWSKAPNTYLPIPTYLSYLTTFPPTQTHPHKILFHIDPINWRLVDYTRWQCTRRITVVPIVSTSLRQRWREYMTMVP